MTDDVESATQFTDSLDVGINDLGWSREDVIAAIEARDRLNRAAERERIAKLCDEHGRLFRSNAGIRTADRTGAALKLLQGARACEELARVIRAMGDE